MGPVGKKGAMTTLIEQAAPDTEGWTVGQVQQLKNVQMCQVQYKSQHALLQLLPRGDMSIRVPFAPSVFRGTGEETRLSIIFETPASVVEHMQKVEATIIEKSRSLIPNIDALWSPCVKPTLHGPQLRCKLNTTGGHKIQLVNEEGGLSDLPIAELQSRRVLPILNVRGVYIQRNQVGLMLDVAACLVGDKTDADAPQIMFV